jgi:hypothetical protein
VFTAGRGVEVASSEPGHLLRPAGLDLLAGAARPGAHVVLSQPRFDQRRGWHVKGCGEHLGGAEGPDQIGTCHQLERWLTCQPARSPLNLLLPDGRQWRVRPALPASGLIPDGLGVAEKQQVRHGAAPYNRG